MKGNTTVLWVDGCYDGFHYGHANLLRQARSVFPDRAIHIIAGTHSDAEIALHKGPTLFDEKERSAVVAGCRFVDEVVEDLPYTVPLAFLQRHDVDFVIHGSDAAMDAAGRDIYAEVKLKGLYVECPRTEGVSTTSLIQRVLEGDGQTVDNRSLLSLLNLFAMSTTPPLPVFDAANRQHMRGQKPANTSIFYVAYDWDCFGAGHVNLLRQAKEQAVLASDSTNVLLLVGVWSDNDIAETMREPQLLRPLEQALAVIQCRYSDGVVLNAPRIMSHDLYSLLGIDGVICLDDSSAVDGVQTIKLVAPTVQTLAGVRKRVRTMRTEYEVRQTRKGYSTQSGD